MVYDNQYLSFQLKERHGDFLSSKTVQTQYTSHLNHNGEVFANTHSQMT